MVEKSIRSIFLEYPEVIYGFTSVSYSSYASEYKSALVLAVPYGEQLTVRNYMEERFEQGIQEAKRVVDEILSKLEEIFHELKYYIISRLWHRIMMKNLWRPFPISMRLLMPDWVGLERMMLWLLKNMGQE